MLRFCARLLSSPLPTSIVGDTPISSKTAQKAVTFISRRRQNSNFYEKNRAAILARKREKREAERARILAKY